MGKRKTAAAADDADGDAAEAVADSLLTYSNLVSVCTGYARDHGLRTDDLGEVLQHLTTHTRWIPSHTMLKSGVGQFYFDLFRSRMTSAPAPVWWDDAAGASATKKRRRPPPCPSSAPPQAPPAPLPVKKAVPAKKKAPPAEDEDDSSSSSSDEAPPAKKEDESSASSEADD